MFRWSGPFTFIQGDDRMAAARLLNAAGAVNEKPDASGAHINTTPSALASGGTMAR